MRAFVAIALERRARDAIVASLASVAQPSDAVRWVRPENLHLTVAFLGQVDESLVPPIDERLAPLAAATRPQELVLDGVGTFSGSRPPILWLGVGEGREWFTELVRRVRAALGTGLGLDLDQREPSAHVTLARMDRRQRAQQASLRSAVAREFAGRSVPSRADRLTLLSSVLRRGGPTYEMVREWPFGRSD